jgi:chromosome partitioning protein
MKKPKFIILINRKGGIGKTTSALNIAANAAVLDNKVLLMDIDPQGNSSAFVGSKEALWERKTVYDLFFSHLTLGDSKKALESLSFSDLIITREIHAPKVLNPDGRKISVDFMPANSKLDRIEVLIAQENNPEIILKKILQKYSKELSVYDYVVIDSPPTINFVVKNAFLASNFIMIPVSASGWSQDGFLEILDDIGLLKEHYGVDLTLLGAFVTYYRDNTTLNKEEIIRLRELLRGHLFNTVINFSVDADYANNGNKFLIESDHKSQLSMNYQLLTQEMLEKIHERY